MRKLPLLAALAVAVTAAPVVGATTGRPALRLVDRTPVTASGHAFAPQEIVRVRLAADGRTWTRRIVAGVTGTFRVRFTVSLGRCASFSLQAFGSAGSRARLFTTGPQPDCSSTG